MKSNLGMFQHKRRAKLYGEHTFVNALFVCISHATYRLQAHCAAAKLSDTDKILEITFTRKMHCCKPVRTVNTTLEVTSQAQRSAPTDQR
jgi:hypothetical protein